MTEATREFGVLLRRARRSSGLTQEELAHRSGLSSRAICDLECGRVARPRGSSLALLVSALAADQMTAAALVAAARQENMTPASWPRDGRQLSTTEPVICELPPAAGDFTGRESQLARLAQHATVALADNSETPAVLVLTGAPGTGKSALAVRLGHLLAAGSQAAQLFVELRTADGQRVAPGAVLRQLLASLGVRDTECPAGQEQRIRLYRSLLYRRKAVVLLDDAADEAQVRPLLPTGRGCVTVITSRHVLTGLAATCRLALAPWPPDEARAFVSRVTGNGRLSADPDAADKLLRFCDGLPLALRIATNRLACRPEWPVAHLVAKLQNEHERLAALSAGDLGVLPAFDLSYQQLSSTAQAAFRRVPLYPGPSFSAGILDILSGQPELDGSACDELRNASLIEPAAAPGRYVMHSLLRLYARSQLAKEAPCRIQAAERRVIVWLRCHAPAAAHALRPAENGGAGAALLARLATGTGLATAVWPFAERPARLAAVARADERDLPDEAITAGSSAG